MVDFKERKGRRKRRKKNHSDARTWSWKLQNGWKKLSISRQPIYQIFIFRKENKSAFSVSYYRIRTPLYFISFLSISFFIYLSLLVFDIIRSQSSFFALTLFMSFYIRSLWRKRYIQVKTWFLERWRILFVFFFRLRIFFPPIFFKMTFFFVESLKKWMHLNDQKLFLL